MEWIRKALKVSIVKVQTHRFHTHNIVGVTLEFYNFCINSVCEFGILLWGLEVKTGEKRTFE